MVTVDEKYLLNRAREQIRQQHYGAALLTLKNCTSERAETWRTLITEKIQERKQEKQRQSRKRLAGFVACVIAIGLLTALAVSYQVARLNYLQFRSERVMVELNEPSISYTDALNYCRGRMSDPNSERSRTTYIPQCIERVQTYGYETEPTVIPGVTLTP